MSSLARVRPWLDPDDEPTLVVYTLAALELSPVAIVEPTASLDEVRTLLVELRAPMIVVVDDEQTLRGVITRSDVLRGGGELAADVMSAFSLSLPLDAPVEQAAAMMAHEGVNHLLVTTAKGELAGVVSALDIARHVALRAGYLAN